MTGDSISPVQPLAEALRHLEISGIFYSPSTLTEPWGAMLPPMADCVWFHAVTVGRCRLMVGDDERELAAGDVALVPHGSGHRLTGMEPAETPLALDLAHEEVAPNYAILRHGGGGPLSRLVCGGLSFDHPVARRLLDALPPIVHIEASRARRGVWATLELLADELERPGIGSDAVISRLCDTLVLQAIRLAIERRDRNSSGWLAAMTDERVGAALAAMHRAPGNDWTVSSLAAEAAMSRSAFAARFSELMGQSAIRYLTELRMQLAAGLLARGDQTVAAVASEVGYESEAAFSRAFSRTVGHPPSRARAAARGRSATALTA